MKTQITAALTVLALAIGIATPAGAQPESAKTACFSAAAWDANDANRPCTTVIAPDNDRVVVIQGTASRELATCVVNIANVNDAHCRRIGANRAAPTPFVPATQAPVHPQAVCTTLHLCASIQVPQEDGSGVVVVTVGSRQIRCTLSNPTEEAGHFSVPCTVH